jgi:hypothetical protein
MTLEVFDDMRPGEKVQGGIGHFGLIWRRVKPVFGIGFGRHIDP